MIAALAILALLSACSPAGGPAPTPVPTAKRPAAAGTPTPLIARPGLIPTLASTQSRPTPTSSLTPTLTGVPTDPTVAIPTPCSSQTGTVTDQQIPTDLLNGGLSFRVYLPPCYHSLEDRRYPVLYLLHGQTYQDDQWTRLGIARTADTLIDSRQISPLIIIMPYDADWRQPTQSHFGDALVQVLLPWVDAHYQTRADRPDRAIGGLSRGAAWAIHLGLADWLQFGAIGAHSLPIFWSDTDQIPKWLDAIPLSDFPRLYLDISAKDSDLQSNLDFEALLNQRHIPHEWHLFPGYHDEAYWQSHLEEYLKWYAQNW